MLHLSKLSQGNREKKCEHKCLALVAKAHARPTSLPEDTCEKFALRLWPKPSLRSPHRCLALVAKAQLAKPTSLPPIFFFLMVFFLEVGDEREVVI